MSRRFTLWAVLACLTFSASPAWAVSFSVSGGDGEGSRKATPQAQRAVGGGSAAPAAAPAEPQPALPQPAAKPAGGMCPSPCAARNNQIVQKLGRGAGNLLGGWMEIPLQIGKRRQASNDKAANFFAGTAVGLGKALQRTFVGAVEIVTFPFAFEGDKPMLPTLDYFDKTKERERLPLE